jgi:hypothetical protein
LSHFLVEDDNWKVRKFLSLCGDRQKYPVPLVLFQTVGKLMLQPETIQQKVQAILTTDARVARVVTSEPRLLPLLSLAAAMPERIDRWEIYEAIKHGYQEVVQSSPAGAEVSAASAYEAFLTAIDDLLPVAPEH